MLKRIKGKAPIIPILAKSDTMTTEELGAFRNEVIHSLDENEINVFHEPFAVVSSVYTKVNENGELVVGREYPWGFVEVENEDYSDLAPLRRCLLTEGLAELKTAKLELYEKFRKNQLQRQRPGLFQKIASFVINTTIKVRASYRRTLHRKVRASSDQRLTIFSLPAISFDRNVRW